MVAVPKYTLYHYCLPVLDAYESKKRRQSWENYVSAVEKRINELFPAFKEYMLGMDGCFHVIAYQSDDVPRETIKKILDCRINIVEG